MSLGPAEIVVILLVGLIVLGPQRLPEVGKQVGRALTQVRNMQATLRDEISFLSDPATETVVTPPKNDVDTYADGGTFT